MVENIHWWGIAEQTEVPGNTHVPWPVTDVHPYALQLLPV